MLANTLANQTPLHVFSDAPKNETAGLAVTEVRSYIRSIAGFKSVTIFERKTNFGLARSIIDGETRLCVVAALTTGMIEQHFRMVTMPQLMSVSDSYEVILRRLHNPILNIRTVLTKMRHLFAGSCNEKNN